MLRRFVGGRGRKILLALVVLLAIGLGPYLVSRARSNGRVVRLRAGAMTQAGEEPASGEPVATLRLLTWNIAHGRGTAAGNWEGTTEEKRQRIEEIARLIAAAEADVVVLNEVDFCATWSGHQNQAEAIAREAGYPYWVEQRNLDFRFLYGSWKFGNALLSRYPIVAAEPLELPAVSDSEQWLAGGKRGCLCTLEISPTQQVRVLAVHLETRDEDIRVESASRILAAAKSSWLPLIAAGDFNSTPRSFPDSRQSSAGENALERLLEAGVFESRPLDPPTPQEMTFPSAAPARVIDWILFPAGWELLEYRAIDSQLSDHRPVVAEVKLPSETGP